MAWLAWAVDDPAPAHCGYGLLNIPCELADPSLRRGNTIHSVHGWFTYVNPSAVMRARGSSWGVTLMRSGQVWKHRPRPTFVNWHAGGPAQNVGTDGIEMEGKDQPWTPEQRASLLRVLRETWAWFGWPVYTLAGPTARTQEGIRQALLAHGYGSLWEHRWFDYTSCPSGRDDWGWLMPALQEGEQEDDVLDLHFIKVEGSDTVHVTDGIFYWTESDIRNIQELVDKKLVPPGSTIISPRLFSRLTEADEGGAVSPPISKALLVAALKQVAREGTG